MVIIKQELIEPFAKSGKDLLLQILNLEVKEEESYIVQEIKKRLSLLIEIGLDYLALGRRADTISGGEAQRIRLASQISSGLMGMIYILDEPSIGLHARDSKKVIKILNHLRDIAHLLVYSCH